MSVLYKFVNFSDVITFYADNDDYARAATLLVGEGKSGCQKEDGSSLDYCFTAFSGEAPKEVYDFIMKAVKDKDEKLLNALNSFAVCDFGERAIFDDYTKNGTDKEKLEKWDETKRTSLNDFCSYAKNLAKTIKNREVADE